MCLIGALQPRLDSCGPSKLMESFADRIFSKCAKPGTATISLPKAKEKSVHYKKVESMRACKPTAKPRSQRARIYKQGSAVMDTLMSGEDKATVSDNVFKTINYMAKQHDYIVARKTELELTVPQCIAMRNHMKGSINTIHCMKQSVKMFVPLLSSFIPKVIGKKVSELKKDGVIPSVVHNVNCIITRTGNTIGMCTLYYCACPADLLSNMFHCMLLDNTFERCQAFSSLEDMLVVAVGFDRVNWTLLARGAPAIVKEETRQSLFRSVRVLKVLLQRTTRMRSRLLIN